VNLSRAIKQFSGINYEKLQLSFKLLQMKKLHLLTLVALIMLGLSGCEKATVTNTAVADVFVKSIKNAQGTAVYTVVHSVFSMNGMTSVSVTGPDGATKQLTNFENGGNSFFNEPATTDYLPAFPLSAVGAYTYIVTFNNGEAITYTNSLSSASLQPVNNLTVAKTIAGDSVYVRWDALADANFYNIEVLRGTTQVYYSDKFYDSSTPKQTNLKIGFRVDNLTAGGTGAFTFNINGLLYETSVYDYLQAISTATANITL
jgi:hypothetical protein